MKKRRLRKLAKEKAAKENDKDVRIVEIDDERQEFKLKSVANTSLD